MLTLLSRLVFFRIKFIEKSLFFSSTNLCNFFTHRLMFWTVWSRDEGSVHRAFTDGTNRSVIWRKNGWPNGLTLDYMEERVYWAGAKYVNGDCIILDLFESTL